MFKRWMTGLMCLSLLACGGSSGSDDDEGGAGEEGEEGEGGDDVCDPSGIDFASGNATAGADIYSGFCQSCHGMDGTGLPDAASPGSKGINLHEEIAEPLPDDCWVKVVKHGEGDMVPVAGITDQQIADVLAYMKANY